MTTRMDESACLAILKLWAKTSPYYSGTPTKGEIRTAARVVTHVVLREAENDYKKFGSLSSSLRGRMSLAIALLGTSGEIDV